MNSPGLPTYRDVVPAKQQRTRKRAVEQLLHHNKPEQQQNELWAIKLIHHDIKIIYHLNKKLHIDPECVLVMNLHRAGPIRIRRLCRYFLHNSSNHMIKTPKAKSQTMYEEKAKPYLSSWSLFGRLRGCALFPCPHFNCLSKHSSTSKSTRSRFSPRDLY